MPKLSEPFAILPYRLLMDNRVDRCCLAVYAVLLKKIGYSQDSWYGPITKIMADTEHQWAGDQAHYAHSSIRRSVRKLEELGYIKTERRGHDKSFILEYFLLAQERDIPPLKIERAPAQNLAGPRSKLSEEPNIPINKPTNNISLATSQATPRESVEKEVTKVYTCPSCGRTFESGDEDFLEKHLIDCDGMEEDTKVYLPRGRPFNDAEKVVWTALAAAFGGEPRTSRQSKQWEIATRELAAAKCGSKEIHMIYRRFHERFKTASCTPIALSAHLSELLDSRSGFQRLAVLPPTVAQVTEKIRDETKRKLTDEERATAAAVEARLKAKQALRQSRQAAYVRLEGEATQ